METFSALLAICAGNSPVPGEFPTQRPVTRSFDVFFDLRPNKRLSKQTWGWWFETLSCSLWRHCNDIWTQDTIWKFRRHASHSGLRHRISHTKWIPSAHWNRFEWFSIESAPPFLYENTISIQVQSSQQTIFTPTGWSPYPQKITFFTHETIWGLN